ncbi:MAG: hypothetical protein GX220_08505 [Treponema sp.]|nr:hypothetical protein [Treponema sp.]
MKRIFTLLVALITILCFVSCSSVANTLATSLAGADKKGVPNKPKKSGTNMMLPLVGETDTELMEDFFPTALKLYEILHTQNPTHQGLATMTGSLYVMYANAFVQAKADMMSFDYSLMEEEGRQIQRAKMHYLRGRDYCLNAFEMRYPGFIKLMMSKDENNFKKALAQLDVKDVNNAYWAGAGWLGAFSVDPLDIEILPTISGGVALLERAAELDPNYNNGAIWEVLTAFYAAAPYDFGGDKDRAQVCFDKAMEISKGKTISVYLLKATAYAIPTQDVKMFDECIEKAMSINPDDNPNTRLATTISRRKAEYLKAHREDLFIIWE